MIDKEKTDKIKEIWDDYMSSNQIVLDTKGNEWPDIDNLRLVAIDSLKEIINQFKACELSLGEFKTNFDNFINEITWNTDIKRFILLTSEALLYLLAFKTKNKLSLTAIIESIIGFGNPVTAQNIIDEFDDI